ncbi:MAG: [protein-PII] uridylyltransferase [Wenzhouxiangellaceae bacterium]|nr:[protein-PII] uridylyltransferase [Wenzhouxiangellaceae bacterium]
MTDRLLAPPASRNCLDLQALERLRRHPESLSRELAEARRGADARLAEAFARGTDIRELVQARAWVIEQLVLAAWDALLPGGDELELVAAGGFGRGELHPHSDADLLILLPEDGAPPPALEDFVRVLWDADLHPGHGVRTVSECIEQAVEDVGVATNLMESRLLAGEGVLFTAMRTGTSSSRIWPADDFFAAKFAEQEQRHEQFEDTVYNLEPDVKNGPGGLRDIQMIAWVTRRHFGTSTLHGLVEHDFMTEREHEELVEARSHLWRVRWALHEIAGRAEERLLFDYQHKLAEVFGHHDPDRNEAVEAFMQGYYRTVMKVERLNEQLLQIFEEELLVGRKHLPSATIDADFRLHHGYLEVVDDHAFVRRPELLLRLFLVLADNEEIRGVRASTIRLIREHLYLIDEAYRRDPERMNLFLELLRRPRRIYSQLERMSRYGVLAALIPGFADVTGRMQFDLFHVYTVDQHILFVVRNLRRIARDRYPDSFGRATEVFADIERPEVLYLAALFHDIAKGRGGDHSELGAGDARAFLAPLDIDEGDAELVAWLVEEHLLMSMTAQRRDISDPAVVDAFADRVGSLRRLRHLFVLTVADIAATRPKLWNSWKDSLLWDLFQATRRRLDGDGDGDVDRAGLAEALRSAARDRLGSDGFDADVVETALQRLPESALVRLDADQLAWTIRCVLESDDLPLVRCRGREARGITEVFIYAEDFDGLFATAAREFDRMELNVLAARVATLEGGRSWDLFQLMDANGGRLNESDAARLVEELGGQLRRRDIRALPARPIPRRLRHFMTRSEIGFDASGALTRMEIATTDRPGLLSAIAEALLAADARLHDARIATFGQRVEDVFMISDTEGRPLSEEACRRLEALLRERLDP